MPAMLPAAAATTALGTGAAVGAGVGALGTGLALGTKLAGGAGIFSNFMAGAAPTLTGGLGTLAPAVVAKVAPAAASQLAGTIGANAAPSIIQSTGLEALKGKVIGAGVQNAAAQQATNLAFQNAAAQNMAGGLANPMSQMGAKFLANSPYPVANASNLNFLNSSVAGGNTMPLGSTYGTQVINGRVVQSSMPPFNAVTTPVAEASSLAPQTSNLAETIRNTNTAMRGNVPISYAEGAQGIAPNAIAAPTSGIQPGQNFLQNLGNFFQDPSMQGVKDYAEEHPYATAGIAGLGAMGVKKLFEQKGVKEPESKAMIRPYTYERTQNPEAYAVSPTQDSSERLYFNDQFIAGEPYKAADGGIVGLAMGGPIEQMAALNAVGANTGYPQANLQTPMYSNPTMQRPEATNVIAPSAGAGVGTYSGEARFDRGGAIGMQGESSSRSTASEPTGGYTYSYDPKTMQFTQLSVPTVKTPTVMNTVGGIGGGGISYGPPAAPQPIKNSGTKVSGGIATPAMGPMQLQRPATAINIPAYQTPEQQLGLDGFYDYMNRQLGGYAGYARGGNVGGEANLGDYSDGGRLLRGPGDGVSDSIPASIGDRQPARLADGEFVVPARIVSELGNGSTEAGARKLYAMMDRVQKGRRKSVGKGKVAVNSKADKYLPA